MGNYRFSIIIPAYNEERYLPRLLDTIEAAAQAYRGGTDSVEVIVGDNCSTDRTSTIAAQRGCKVAEISNRCIAAVRNGGAALATYEILCFVDADMRIHPETFNALHDALEKGNCIAGSTGIRLERMSVGLAVTLALMMPMLWMAKIDTGVVFCRRDDFDAVGGYNEDLPIAEDVTFLMELKKLGRTRGRKLTRVTTAKALSSTRKWDQHGEMALFLRSWVTSSCCDSFPIQDPRGS